MGFVAHMTHMPRMLRSCGLGVMFRKMSRKDGGFMCKISKMCLGNHEIEIQRLAIGGDSKYTP